MKTRIIDCTLRLLGQSGLRNFTMDAVAATLRISKRTLYQHFTSKEQLLESCLTTWFDRRGLFVPAGENLIDELCMLHFGLRTAVSPRELRCCRELRTCSVPVYRLFLERLFDYAEACGTRAAQDAATGYLCRDVSQETISSVVSDFLTRFFFGNDLRPPVRRHTPAPELLLVFTRGLCTIKGRAYLDRRLKNNTLK